MKKILSSAWELVKMIAISLAIVLPVRYFLIQPFYVKGASMEPNFYDREYLIIDEISYRFEAPERGDIVVFRYPHDPREYFIKRVIGLPGETVELKDGQVYIHNQEHPDGELLVEPYINEAIKTYSYTVDKVNVGADEYYVLGDNRLASKDSRSFGPVNKSFIIGRVFLRGWPFERAGLIK